MADFNIINDAPTVLSPNGGETYAGGSITIRWVEPSSIPSNMIVWYEIYITDNYKERDISSLIQIGTVPSGKSSLVYSIPQNLKGERCRIAVRAVNHLGQRSSLSFSASNFSIINKKLPTPALHEPISGQTYFSYVPFVFDSSAIIGRASQRSFYQIYYASENLGIKWTLLAANIMIGSDPFQIDVSGFSVSSDYEFKVQLFDGTNVSEPVFIRNVTINNVNYFLIDTLPPKGYVKIQNNKEYTNVKNIILEMEAYDETTGVKEFRIEQEDVSSNTSTIGVYRDMTNLSTWYLSGNDGVKLIQGRFKDYAGNVVEDSSDTFFRTYKNLSNRIVTAFLYGEGHVWYAFGYGETSADIPLLYRDQMLVSELDGEATSMSYFNGSLFIAIKDDENKGILQRLGTTVTTIRDNDSQYTDSSETIVNYLYDADSVINSMVVFDSKLFLGLENGVILSYSGSAIETVDTSAQNIKKIIKIVTDDVFLYVYFENSTEIMIGRKAINGEYSFRTIDTGE